MREHEIESREEPAERIGGVVAEPRQRGWCVDVPVDDDPARPARIEDRRLEIFVDDADTLAFTTMSAERASSTAASAARRSAG